MTGFHFVSKYSPLLIKSKRWWWVLAVVIGLVGPCPPLFAQQGTSNLSTSEMTPRQRAIEKERRRMGSFEAEERRDAVMKLGAMKHPDAARVAAGALNDSEQVIRATAASAVLALPAEEAATILIPLLKDKREFVRQQVAHALGATRSSLAVDPLVAVLVKDKMPSVRGAAAVALGLIADERAAGALARVVYFGFVAIQNNVADLKFKKEGDVFVQRAAARALGQMRSRRSVPALIAAMADQRLNPDVRREIVYSLGLIGDVAAVPVLREALAAKDPYLAQNAYDALRKISSSDTTARP